MRNFGIIAAILLALSAGLSAAICGKGRMYSGISGPGGSLSALYGAGREAEERKGGEQMKEDPIKAAEVTERCTGEAHTWTTRQVLVREAWYEQVPVMEAYDEQVLVMEEYDETVPVRAAYDEQVLVRDAYDEQVVTSPAWDEQVLISAAWDEQVQVSAAWDEEKWEVHLICDCGIDITAMGWTADQYSAHLYNDLAAGIGCGSAERYVMTGVVHHDAVYTTVHHDAVYTTIHHGEEYTTVHHDAEYAAVHHDAEYAEVHHEAQYTTVHHDEEYAAILHEAQYRTETYCSVCGEIKSP